MTGVLVNRVQETEQAREVARKLDNDSSQDKIAAAAACSAALAL